MSATCAECGTVIVEECITSIAGRKLCGPCFMKLYPLVMEGNSYGDEEGLFRYLEWWYDPKHNKTRVWKKLRKNYTLEQLREKMRKQIKERETNLNTWLKEHAA
jgi:hypothetical protein